ncbi:hypothetical protein BN903_47 [Halorubrum sp. AJ67]|nr:hypothetical protein BN903_47 [Halorubrum sp. AJ67]
MSHGRTERASGDKTRGEIGETTTGRFGSETYPSGSEIDRLFRHGPV